MNKVLLYVVAVAMLLALVTANHNTRYPNNYKSEIIANPGFPDNDHKSPLPHTYIDASTLPESFSWDEQGIALPPVKNQHIPVYCGSCWAFGNAYALSSRVNIIRKGAFPTVDLSVQKILNCNHEAGSCNGGTSPGVLASIKRTGIPQESCQNYQAIDGTCEDSRAECKDCSRNAMGESYCWPLNYTKVYIEEYGKVSGVENIKAEIYARGPVSAGINANGILNLTNSFYQIDVDTCRKYGDGVNHVLVILGWKTIETDKYNEYGLKVGTEKQQYWVILNSWGINHGSNGRGLIAMGGNCLGIEEYVYWSMPKLDTIPPY